MTLGVVRLFPGQPVHLVMNYLVLNGDPIASDCIASDERGAQMTVSHVLDGVAPGARAYLANTRLQRALYLAHERMPGDSPGFAPNCGRSTARELYIYKYSLPQLRWRAALSRVWAKKRRARHNWKRARHHLCEVAGFNARAGASVDKWLIKNGLPDWISAKSRY